MDYPTWVVMVKAEGGVPTFIPTVDQWPGGLPVTFQPYAGLPAARYSGTMYAALYNAGQIDPNAPTTSTTGGQYVYVVAPPDVADTAPQTMSVFQSIENTVFGAGDTAAAAVGLPSLTGIEQFLKDTGKEILIGVGVTLAVAYLAHRKS